MVEIKRTNRNDTRFASVTKLWAKAPPVADNLLISAYSRTKAYQETEEDLIDKSIITEVVLHRRKSYHNKQSATAY